MNSPTIEELARKVAQHCGFEDESATSDAAEEAISLAVRAVKKLNPGRSYQGYGGEMKLSQCAKCGKSIARIYGHWIHLTHEAWQNCGFAKKAR